MFTPRLLALPVTASLAFASPVHAQSAEDVARLTAAIASVGCVVDNSNQAAVLSASGLSENAAGQVLRMLVGTGEIVPSNEEFMLISGPCLGGRVTYAPGVAEAIEYLNGLPAEAAADFLTSEIETLGCVLSTREDVEFDRNILQSVARRFGIDLPTPLPDASDPQFGALLAALDDMENRGGQYLQQAGRLDMSEPGTIRLTECGLNIPDGPPPAELTARLFEYSTADILGLEADVFAEIECAVPIDMVFSMQAMMLDWLLDDAGLSLGPDLAVEVMAILRFGETSNARYAEQTNYAALVVDEVSRTMEETGRVTRDGRLLFAEDCTPSSTSTSANLRAYVTSQ